MATVLITGANRGIGLELARQLSDRGDRVIALVRHSSAALDALGVEVIQNVDVTELSSIETAKNQLGGIQFDVVINNAGILKSETLGALDQNAFDQIDEQFSVNALGPLKVMSVFLDSLNVGGKCMLITSRMGSIADNTSGSRYGYRMSKAALNMAGMSLSHDLKARQISVGILHPGWVQTDMTGRTGNVTAEESANLLIQRMDNVSMANTGTFWHANGEVLPW